MRYYGVRVPLAFDRFAHNLGGLAPMELVETILGRRRMARYASADIPMGICQSNNGKGD